MYGANETNPLIDPDAYYESDFVFMNLSELAAKGGRVTRVRFLTDFWPGMGKIADLSYCHGTLPDGTRVHVNVTGGDLMGCPMNKITGELINWAKKEGVFAKGIGLLDRGNWSILG